nr:ABC transporter substrate-binding protein [Angustibacter aerolatus]
MARSTAPRRSGHALRAASLLAVGALALSACAGTRPSEAANDTSKPLVIGISLPLTGDFSQPGSEAKRGYEVWAKQVNGAGGLLGRQVQAKIVDDASSQDTVVSDYTKAHHPGQGRPGARHLLVAAELPGVRRRGEERHDVRRAGRRRAEHVHPRLQAPVLRAARDGPAPGRRVRRLPEGAARGGAAEDGGLPDAGRPVRDAGHRVDAEAGSRRSG